MWSPSFPFALFRLAYVWAGACTALHGCLHAALKPQRLPRLSALSRKELGVLVNTLVAGCHAGVMFWGTARYMLSRFEPTWRVFTITQVSPNSPTENRYCDLMLGYLLYDCAVGVLAGGNGADILAHHLAGLASWACLRLYDTGGIYMMWVHLAEVRAHASATANAALTLCTLLWLVGIHALPARHHGAVQAGLGQHGGVPRVRALHAAEFHACAGPLSALVSAVHVAHPGAVGRAPLSVCDHDGHQQRVHSPQYPLVDQAAEESTGPQGRAQEVTRTRAGGCGQGQGRMSDKCPPRCVGLWSYAPRLLLSSTGWSRPKSQQAPSPGLCPSLRRLCAVRAFSASRRRRSQACFILWMAGFGFGAQPPCLRLCTRRAARDSARWRACVERRCRF